MNRFDFYGLSEALTALLLAALYLVFIVTLCLAFTHPAPAREFDHGGPPVNRGAVRAVL
jgi:hypothetical protein